MESNFKPKLDSNYSYYVLSVLLVVYIFNFLDRQIIAILANDIREDLGISLSDLGFLYGTAFAIFYSIVGIPLAKLADTWHRNYLISGGVAIWSLMTAASGLMRSFVGLAICRIGVGIGESSASPAAYSLLSDYFSTNVKTTVYSIYSSGIYIGGGIGIFLGGWIADSWNNIYPIAEQAPFQLAGWQIAFISVGLPGLLIALLVLTIKEPIRGHSEGIKIEKEERPFFEAGKVLSGILPISSLVSLLYKKEKSPEIYYQIFMTFGVISLVTIMSYLTGDLLQWGAFGLGLFTLLSWIQTVKLNDPIAFSLGFKSKTIIFSMIGFPLISFMGYAVSAFLPAYFIETFEVTKTVAGRNLGLQSAIFGFFGLLTGGLFSDYLRKKYLNGRIYVGIFAVVTSPISIILALQSKDLFTFYVFHIIWSYVSTLWVGLCVATVTDMVLPRMRAMISAFWILMASVVGLSLGPYSIGKLADYFISLDYSSANSISYSIQIWCSVFIISLIALILAAKYLPEEENSKVERARLLGEQI